MDGANMKILHVFILFLYAYVARLGDSHTGVEEHSRLPRCCVLSLIYSNRRFGGA